MSDEKRRIEDTRIADIYRELKVISDSFHELDRRQSVTEVEFDTHQRSCMEKHDTVIKTMLLTNDKFDAFKTSFNNKMVGGLIALILALLTTILSLITHVK